MKKLLTVLALVIAFALASFAMTACPGGDNLPNNPKGQVLNQPESAPIDNATPANEGGAAAPPAKENGEDEDMPDDGDD